MLINLEKVNAEWKPPLAGCISVVSAPRYLLSPRGDSKAKEGLEYWGGGGQGLEYWGGGQVGQIPSRHMTSY